ncbi:MAG: hypothetical protein OIN87_08755 [Candidatus Methanoperedens sp.]|nr:hypothetical protein [Candidatus Methanoperedens sp.]
MIDWNDNLVKLIISIIYGVIFIEMFLFLTMWRKRITHIEFMNDFGSLAIFALLRGISEFLEIPRILNWEPLWIFDIMKLILVSSAFAALLSFGLNVATAGIEENRWLRGIPHGALLMYFWFLTFIGVDIVTGGGTGINYKVAEIAQKQTLGFLGSVVTSYAFFELSGKINTIAGESAGKKFRYTGVWFALYAIFEGLNVNLITGFPDVIYSCAIAIFITISVINIFQLFEVKKPV